MTPDRWQQRRSRAWTCTQRSDVMRTRACRTRAQQRKYRVGYRTVAASTDSAWPKASSRSQKRQSRLEPYHQVIDTWLREDPDAPRKQLHTAKRIFDRLLGEHHATGVSYWIGPGVRRESPQNRRKFTAEYRDEAVKLVLDGPRPIAEAARELGLNEGALGNWVNTYRKAHPQDEEPLTLSERARLREQERELRELRMQNEFLKKRRPSSRATGSEVRIHLEAGCGEGLPCCVHVPNVGGIPVGLQRVA